ncbi:2-hydroxy-3-keto-5-methylthiopentenyl-1-phosphate phosphatase [Bacillus sp. V3-13]|nr:2-hydroxy-3-keto-5-methylthiopentenyl-1-phosphate phosphatase [Bacillus sp. V3-13]
MKKHAVFCDFDGTITEKDNIIAIMEKFAPSDSEPLKEQILSGQISIMEGVGKLFSLLPSSLKDEIIDFAVENAVIRAGFKEFAAFLANEDIPLYIVSGGIDFFVEPILEGTGPITGLYCNGSDFSAERIKILWPHSCDSHCSNGCGCCKPSVIRSLDGENLDKIVIGDSITDVEAAKQADFILARDLLARKCEELGLPYKPFNTFFDCVDSIREKIGVRA